MFHTRVTAESGEAGTPPIFTDKASTHAEGARSRQRLGQALVLWFLMLTGPWFVASLQAQNRINISAAANIGPAVDSAGSIYYLTQDNKIVKATPSANGYTESTLLTFQSLDYQSNLVVDSAGVIYYLQNGSIKKEVPGSGGGYTETVIPGSVTGGLAVDASGNLYGTTSGGITKFTLSGGSYTSAPVISGLNAPNSVAVDSGGNLYVVERGASRVVKEILSGGQYTQSVLISNLIAPSGIAVDGQGNVYAADNRHIYKAVPSGSAYAVFLFGYFDSQTPATPISPQHLALNPQGTSLIVQGAYSSNGFLLLAYATDPLPPPGLQFSPVALGSQATQTLTFTFANPVTLGSYRVTTQSATGKDYIDAGGGTCTAGGSYSAGGSCTVKVTFTPRFAGSRAGAVTFLDGSGAVIADAVLSGTGTGPQLVFAPATVTSVSKNGAFNGIAVDGNGAVYLSDMVNKRVLKETPGNSGAYTEAVIASGLVGPYGVAVDGAGNVYVIDNDMTIGASGHYDSGTVLKLTPNGTTYTKATIGTGYGLSRGIAVDSRGNVYVSDTDGINNLYVYRLAPLPNGNYSNTVLFTAGTLGGIAVDAAGVVYVADGANGRVYRYVPDANGAYTGAIVGLGTLFAGSSIAVDGAGNLYVAGVGSGANPQAIRVANIDSTGSGTLTYSAGSNIITVDASGSVYGIGSQYTAATGTVSGVYRADQATPPTLTFDPTAVGSTSTYPVSVQLTNIGTAPLNFKVPGSGNNPVISTGFSIVNYQTDGCPVLTPGAAAATLTPGSECRTFMSAVPVKPGPYTGTLTFTDDNVNVAGATQVVNLNGTGTGNAPPAATLTWATPAPIASGTPLSATQLNAVANVPGTYVYTPPAGTVLSPGSHTLSVTFTPADTSSYSSATATVTIQVTSSPTTSVTWAPPAAINYGTALGATQLNATATVPGTFVYTPAAGTVLSAGTHTLSVTFTPTDTTLQPITATVSIVVNQAVPTITWATPAAIGYGTPLSAAQLNATASVPGTLTYTPPAGTVLSVGNQTLSVTLTPTDSVNYAPATATVVLQVSAASLDFTFTNAGTAYQTVIPGSATNYAFALAPTGGSYPGDVSFTVTGLPAGATYTISPATVSASAGAQTETLQVQTAPYSAANTRGPLSPSNAVWACMLAPLSLLALRRRRRAFGRSVLLPLLLAVVSLWGCMGLVGCGSGNGFFGLQPKDYTVTVTASSGNIQHAATVTLNLQ